jgi:hypothetical protein
MDAFHRDIGIHITIMLKRIAVMGNKVKVPKVVSGTYFYVDGASVCL